MDGNSDMDIEIDAIIYAVVGQGLVVGEMKMSAMFPSPWRFGLKENIIGPDRSVSFCIQSMPHSLLEPVTLFPHVHDRRQGGWET